MLQLLARLGPYFCAAPLALILLAFLAAPVAIVATYSFWDYNDWQVIPAFVTFNYTELFSSSLTYKLYWRTFQLAFWAWLICFIVGFSVAYVLAFHVRSQRMQIILFLICTIPFWTSNIIRMIAWIPVLGRNGLVNTTLQSMGLTDAPIDWLLYSPFAVILAFVHLYALFMIVPIFNTMMRINPEVIEAARDAGASGLQIVRRIIIPLTLPGVAIGTIFVVSLVMGDFVTIKMMAGGQVASVGVAMRNEIALLQYPPASAAAVVLLIVVLAMVVGLMRFVNIRKSL